MDEKNSWKTPIVSKDLRKRCLIFAVTNHTGPSFGSKATAAQNIGGGNNQGLYKWRHLEFWKMALITASSR